MDASHGSAKRGADEGARRPAGEFGRFGKLFPELDGQSWDEAELRALAETMIDNGPEGDPARNNANVPAGYTYLGQFIDHDITFDTSGLGEALNDPEGLLNFRTPRLDLDGLYGGGPAAMPHLYDRLDARKFLIGRCGPGSPPRPNDPPGTRPVKAGLPNDLPRTREGLALISDPRNDENLLVAQTHLALLKFHNKVVDRLDAEGSVAADRRFEEARKQVRWHYQWSVINDFLDRLVDFNDVHDVLSRGRKFYRFEEQSAYREPYMPLEFSVAAYRLGHSMVREVYSHNRVFRPGAGPATFGFLFNFSGKSGGIIGDLLPEPGSPGEQAARQEIIQRLGLPKLTFPGGPPGGIDPILTERLPGDWAIDWHRFYELGTPQGSPPANVSPSDNAFLLNLSRRLDPYLVPSLHNLPGSRPGFERLALLNLLRGVKMGLPSGQDVAKRLGVPVLKPADIADSNPNGATDGQRAAQLGMHERTPLWYYVLKEAQLKGNEGQRLGPVGSRILAEVFVGLLEGDAESYLSVNRNWKPTLPAANAGDFTMPDLLRFVGDLDPVNQASSF